MKTSTITILGYITGFIFISACAIRYYVMYPDLDKVLFYIFIGGLTIFGFSWVYNVLKSFDNKFDEVDNKFEETNHRIDAVEDALFEEVKVE